MKFLSRLNDHAHKQDVFRMKFVTDDLVMDVIGKVVPQDFCNRLRRAALDLLFSSPPKM